MFCILGTFLYLCAKFAFKVNNKIKIMATLDLTKYGITGSKVIAHNPSYEFLFEEETKAGLTGFDKGVNTELNAVNVMTGIYTGRSPKDKYIVCDAQSKDKVWWTTEEY